MTTVNRLYVGVCIYLHSHISRVVTIASANAVIAGALSSAYCGSKVRVMDFIKHLHICTTLYYFIFNMFVGS